MRYIFIILLLGVAARAQTGTETAVPDKAGDSNDPHWHQTAKDIARVYGAFGRVDDQARWAPWLCAPPDPGQIRFSKATKGTPHARKLYTLFAKDPKAYGARETAQGGLVRPPRDAVGKAALERIAKLPQVIVKESWVPEKMTSKPSEHQFSKNCNWGKSGIRPTKKGDAWYRGKEPGPLFLMFQPGKTAKKTDAGWIYATVESNGKVTGAGRMQSCMECHRKRPDRLFGLPQQTGKPDKNR